ncbi:MAG: imidazole glycerol phosphate synthase subunit HisH [Hyphomicrobiales bacterium]|nr:imidazole glycerol phosphate synthase subunit HisH [Hyphomicrobiales bacterium]MCY4048441.1 imidazole glycerol phosphate synthase subunit HisH [Hyphomicrobiales bacterium]
MDVGILDCGSGNLRSLAKAVERAGESHENLRVHIIRQPNDIARMERLLLPGVGAFGYTMEGLENLRPELEEAVLAGRKPFLGICVGMQILMEWGYEHGRSPGLGWLQGATRPLEPQKDLRVPHMGWNELHVPANTPHPVFENVNDNSSRHVYFAHSYHVCLEDEGSLIATSEYGGTLTAAVGRDNILGVQFHPEKSQRVGLSLLRNFLGWKP